MTCADHQGTVQNMMVPNGSSRALREQGKEEPGSVPRYRKKAILFQKIQRQMESRGAPPRTLTREAREQIGIYMKDFQSPGQFPDWLRLGSQGQHRELQKYSTSGCEGARGTDSDALPSAKELEALKARELGEQDFSSKVVQRGREFFDDNGNFLYRI
ncbi:hypothetical protein QTO34_014157 [Cnephaeus nilssonii]|uniref:Neugrin n=1 Tax=Cnephaeus nilssonii TaxID=3371016 RepID=A0AA40HAD0_CNENI|nr:hypothetical protein QTO34_014157 [Eptesicus nilssonii]